jgi:vancomycin resistance protein YoaR
MMRSNPTRLSTAVFNMKAAALRTHRTVTDLRNPIPRHQQRNGCTLPFTIARSQTELFPDPRPSEQWHQRAKVENLRLAAPCLDGCFIPAGEVFSFWRQVGKVSVSRGFQLGRALQEGSLILSVGGGLCQLSNAVFQVAVQSGCEILERHCHSRLIPGSAMAAGRDAAVAWNYVDLRFRSSVDLELTIALTADHLIVEMHAGVHDFRGAQSPEPFAIRPLDDDPACSTCTSNCFRRRVLPQS